MSHTPPRPRRSAWIVAGTVLFVVATLAFLGFWTAESSSGLGRLFQRTYAIGSFLVLWAVGLVCLVVGALRRRHRRERPALPLLPAGLALVSALLLVWIAFLRVTPERLVRAAGQGDLGEVERCLRRGVDVDARYTELLGFGGKQESPTALGAAAASGRTEVVRFLLAAGADPAATNVHGRTPAQLAETGGFDELAALLRAGEEPDGTGEPPPR